MNTWLAPRKAAIYINALNSATMIKEHTIRKLIEAGFPCLNVGRKTLIRMETFENDLVAFTNQKVVQNRQIDEKYGVRKIIV